MYDDSVCDVTISDDVAIINMVKENVSGNIVQKDASIFHPTGRQFSNIVNIGNDAAYGLTKMFGSLQLTPLQILYQYEHNIL